MNPTLRLRAPALLLGTATCAFNEKGFSVPLPASTLIPIPASLLAAQAANMTAASPANVEIP